MPKATMFTIPQASVIQERIELMFPIMNGNDFKKEMKNMVAADEDGCITAESIASLLSFISTLQEKYSGDYILRCSFKNFSELLKHIRSKIEHNLNQK